MKFLITAAALLASVQAGLRFPCSTLTTQRLDPAAEPGSLPSAHVHHIVGGNAFNATMLGDVAERATCTTCQMSEDFSNYWVAQMYFRDPKNGTFHMVDMEAVQPLLGGSQGAQGGLTVYYTQFDLSRDNLAQQPITAFPKGFRMTTGNPAATEKVQTGLTYQCYSGMSRTREVDTWPAQKCPTGIFTSHHFPACWDGKNLDSADHQSHMYYSKRMNGFINDGPCPASHPIRTPQVAFEIQWKTGAYNNLWDYTGPDSIPFVWSFGPNGYGTHADYMFGWKDDSLQRAMDKSECFYDGCGSIEKQPMAEANKCTVPQMVEENVADGWMESLPGQGLMK